MPINTRIILKNAGKPVWWIVLFLIPVANIVTAIVVGINVAKSFGQRAGAPTGGGPLCELAGQDDVRAFNEHLGTEHGP